jgi:chromosome segregation ATPase
MRPQEVSLLKDNVAQTLAVLKGDFDTEIKALKAATAEWDSRNKLDTTKKEVAEALADLAQKKASAEAQVVAHQARLNTLQDELQAKEAALKEREQQISRQEAAQRQAVNALDRERAEFRTMAQSMNADLEAKQKAVQETLSVLAERGAAIGQREANVKQALAQVGTLVN